MKKIVLLLVMLVAIPNIAQEHEWFYATMSLEDAKALEKDVPGEIDIIQTRLNEAAVFMNTTAAHKLHDRILVHGPGYVFKANEAEAIKALQPNNVVRNRQALTITEDAMVAQVLPLIDTQRIADHIVELENYGTRYHNRASATQAAVDLKTKWEAIAAQYNRDDVSVRLFEHDNTDMPSVILTIEGAKIPDEFVIVGGHLDSTSSQGNNDAPGADDDASGIATITEAARALFESGFVPKRTIEIMAYAAEEVGLVGSAEIANEYANANVDVVAVGQFDMTNFNGSANDVYFITDFTNSTLNSYFMELLDHYNGSGAHEITYSTSLCNYGCSDHASWNAEGYRASFPFEASFGQHNNNIHTRNDTFSVSGTATHATKFAKLCAEFLIEVAKSTEVLGVAESSGAIFASMNGNTFVYNVTTASLTFETIQIYDALGKKVLEFPMTDRKGTFKVNTLASGLYIAKFTAGNGTSIAKKVLKK